MMKFSQRIGKTSVRECIQIESIDPDLTNRLWNNILVDYFGDIDNHACSGKDSKRTFILKMIWGEFFGKPVDEFPKNIFDQDSNEGAIQIFKQWFYKGQWYDKFDFIEFISSVDANFTNMNWSKTVNNTLEKGSSGYRIISNKIVQVIAEEEVAEIEEAINNSKFKEVQIHLKTSLDYLSSKDKQDYRNSIKESISAVESMCALICGNEKATLGEALTLIESKYKIHSAQKKGFSALYGYTSDSGGIRHSLVNDDIVVKMEDAKFMLIICSAFINYLKMKI
jgi:hypothetical protein